MYFTGMYFTGSARAVESASSANLLTVDMGTATTTTESGFAETASLRTSKDTAAD